MLPNTSFFKIYVLYLFIKYSVSEHIVTILPTKANICFILFLFTNKHGVLSHVLNCTFLMALSQKLKVPEGIEEKELQSFFVN